MDTSLLNCIGTAPAVGFARHHEIRPADCPKMFCPSHDQELLVPGPAHDDLPQQELHVLLAHVQCQFVACTWGSCRFSDMPGPVPA